MAPRQSAFAASATNRASLVEQGADEGGKCAASVTREGAWAALCKRWRASLPESVGWTSSRISPPGIVGTGVLRFFGWRFAASAALWRTRAMIGFVGCLVMYRAPAPQPFARGLLGYGAKRTDATPRAPGRVARVRGALRSLSCWTNVEYGFLLADP